MPDQDKGPSCSQCGTPITIGCEHTKAISDQEFDARFEAQQKKEYEAMADRIRADLVEALAALDQAKLEMGGGDLESSYKTMGKVQDVATGVSINAERLTILLRQQLD